MKRECIILLIILAMGLLDLHQTSSAYAKEMSFEEDIEKYKTEAKSLISSANDPKLADTTKSLKGFTDNPEEGSLNEEDLRIKGDEKIKGKNIKENEEEGEREAINAVKHSNANNPHRSKYTVTKLKNKAFMKKSAAIVENPISGLNVAANAGCKIVGGDKGGENVSFEEYYVDVEDMRVKEVKQTCEEDEDRLFYCNRSIKDVNCSSKSPCAFDKAEGEGGLYTSASNSEFASSSGGKFKWNYNEGTGELMFGNESSYSYDDADESCLTKEFTAKFFIKDKVNVSEFAMSEVFENNVMDIWVNGSLIYEGERYGVRTSRPECRAKRGGGGMLMGFDILGRDDEACWLNACQEHWRAHYKDLKNYIRDGWNEIRVKLRYTRSGHAGLKIKAKQYCCNNWSDEWESDCPVNE